MNFGPNTPNTNTNPWAFSGKPIYNTDTKMTNTQWGYNAPTTKISNTQPGYTNTQPGYNIDLKVTKLEEKVKKLEKKIDTISLNNSKRKYLEITHVGIFCNNCQKQNINGIRYLCGNCQQYNLCHKCIIYTEEIHPLNHFFIRIPDSKRWNQINNIQPPQVPHNFNV